VVLAVDNEINGLSTVGERAFPVAALRSSTVAPIYSVAQKSKPLTDLSLTLIKNR